MRKKIVKAAAGIMLSCCMLTSSFSSLPAGVVMNTSAAERVDYTDAFLEVGPAGDCTYSLFTQFAEGEKFNAKVPDSLTLSKASKLDYYLVHKVGEQLSAEELDNQSIHYDVDLKLTGNAYFGVTLTQKGEDGHVNSEFQIIENWGETRPAAEDGSCGTVQVGDKIYDMYKTKKKYIENDGSFREIDLYMTVSRESGVKSDTDITLFETVRFKEFITAWADAGVEFNNINNYGLFVHGTKGGCFIDVKQMGDYVSRLWSLVGSNSEIEKSEKIDIWNLYHPAPVEVIEEKETTVSTDSGKVGNHRYSVYTEKYEDGSFNTKYTVPDSVHISWNEMKEMEYSLVHDYNNIEYTSLGDYNYSVDFSSTGKTWYGITVRTTGSDGLVNAEYQIIDGWGSWNPGSNAEKIGEYADSDNFIYDLYKTEKTFREDDGTEHTIDLYMSVRAISTSRVHSSDYIQKSVDIKDQLDAFKECGAEIDSVASAGMFVASLATRGAILIKRAEGFSFDNSIVDENPDLNVQLKGKIDHISDGQDFRYDDLNNGISTFVWDSFEGDGKIMFQDHAYDEIGGNGFSCEWKDRKDTLFYKGYFLDGQEIGGDTLESLDIDYECMFEPEGNACLGCYGWFNGGVSIEYYIIDAWNKVRPATDSEYIGSFTSEGKVYDIYKDRLVIDPTSMLFPENKKKRLSSGPTPLRYFSVCRTNQYDADGTGIVKGKINVADHFKAWRKAGLDLSDIYEIYFGIEACESNGTADITKLEFSRPLFADKSVDCGDVVIDKATLNAISGDLNNDGVVNVFDVLICRKELCSKIDGNTFDTACDVNADGEFTIADLIVLSRFVAGSTDSLTEQGE